MRATCHQVKHSMLWTVLVASAFSCSDTNGPETTDETCLHQLDTKPETATVVLGDSILFESTYLRACSITPPFIWSASPDGIGDFAVRSDTSAVFRSRAVGIAAVRIRDQSRIVGEAAVIVVAPAGSGASE